MEGSPFMCSGNSTSIFFQTTATTRPRTGEESYCEYSNTKKTPYSYKRPPLLECLALNLEFWSFVWAIFDWVSKVTGDGIGFSSFGSVIGPEDSRHSLNQSHAKLTPITTWSLFPLVPLVLFFSLCWLPSFLLTGHCGYLSFVFKTLNPKVLYEQVT